LARYKFILTILLFPVITFPQKFPDTEIDSLLTLGISQIVNQNYGNANKTFNVLDSLHPELPLGKTYKAALLIAKSTDYAEKYNVKRINKLLDSAKVRCEALLNSNEADVWNNYFMALTLGYKAYFRILTDNYIDAFLDGYRSVQYFERCKDIEPDFYESYLAIGTYKYWKSAKASSLNWLPFFTDNRKEGIKLLEEAVRNSSYNKYLALNSLIWIYINEKNDEKAIEVAEQALKDFPGSRFFMWGLARAYEDVDIDKAINIFYRIRKSLQAESHLSNINNVILLHKIAMLNHKTGNLSESLKLLTEIENIKLNGEEKERLENRLRRVKQLKNEILQSLSGRQNR